VPFAGFMGASYQMHTSIPTYMHTHVHTNIHAYMHACIHTYMHAYIHTFRCGSRTRTRMHTHTHTHTHTHAHTCVHILQVSALHFCFSTPLVQVKDLPLPDDVSKYRARALLRKFHLILCPRSCLHSLHTQQRVYTQHHFGC